MCGRVFAATDNCTALSAMRGIAACAAKFKYVTSSIGNHSFFQSIDCLGNIVLGYRRETALCGPVRSRHHRLSAVLTREVRPAHAPEHVPVHLKMSSRVTSVPRTLLSSFRCTLAWF